MTKQSKIEAENHLDLLAETKRKIHETNNEREACLRECREVNNVLVGLRPDGYAPRDRILAADVAEQEAKLAKLRDKSAELAAHIAHLGKLAFDLEAMEIPEETLLEIAIDQYKRVAPTLQELMDRQRDLTEKRRVALDKKSHAESTVRSAEGRKNGALSHDEISAANRELAEARQHLDDVLALIVNIEKAQARLPDEIAAARGKIQNAERDVWTAHFNYLAARLRNDEAFSVIKDLVDSAYAAYFKAAGGGGFAWVVSKLMDPPPDPDRITQMQKEMAFGLGLL